MGWGDERPKVGGKWTLDCRLCYVYFPSNLTLIEWKNIQTLCCAFAQAQKLSSLNVIARQVPMEKAQLAGSMGFELTSHYVSLFELIISVRQ